MPEPARGVCGKCADTKAKTKYGPGVAEAAGHVREDLAKAFPGQKFSVRSEHFSGGSAIDIEWLDGPAENDVRRIALRHQCPTPEESRSDPMSDYCDVTRFIGTVRFMSAANVEAVQKELGLPVVSPANPQTGYTHEQGTELWTAIKARSFPTSTVIPKSGMPGIWRV